MPYTRSDRRCTGSGVSSKEIQQLQVRCMRWYTAKLVYNFTHGRYLSGCHRASAHSVLHPFFGHVQQGKDQEIAFLFNSMLSQTGKWISVCIKARFQVCVGVSARAR